METIKIKATRSDGVTFNYESSDWGVQSLAGVEFAEMELFTEPKGFGNGEIVTGKRKKGRTIEIAAKLQNFTNLTNFAQLRKQMMVFHNSSYTFDLEVTVLGTTRIVKECELTAGSYPTVKVDDIDPTLIVAFQSPYAVLFADFTDNEQMFSIDAKWHSDRIYHEDFTNIYGVETRIKEKSIYYAGSEPAPIIVTITANGLIEENISININDNILTIDTDLTAGDVLEINAETYDVFKNGVALSPSKYNSEVFPYMNVEYGDNVLKIESGDNLAFNSEINYTGRYDGV